MLFFPKALIYKALIDPILARLHPGVLRHAEPGMHIIDIACGTGALAIAMARNAEYVTGIDLDEDLIAAARYTAGRLHLRNIEFRVHDASNLTDFSDHSFDMAVTSMAIHQFEPGLAISLLREMRRIARRQILVDYNHHMPRSWGRSLTWGIEALAGGDHYRNFRNYMASGGLPYFTREAGLSIQSEVLRGGGVFVVAKTSERGGDREMGRPGD